VIVTCPNCGAKNRVPAVAEGVPRCGVCQTALPWIVNADAGSFDAVIASDLLVLVDFWAPWCGPCLRVSPAVEVLGRKHAGKLKVVKLDIDTAPDVARRFDVASIPTLLVLRDGAEVDRIVGAMPANQIETTLTPHLDAAAAERTQGVPPA
jgi:thioredoxin 2